MTSFVWGGMFITCWLRTAPLLGSNELQASSANLLISSTYYLGIHSRTLSIGGKCRNNVLVLSLCTRLVDDDDQLTRSFHP